MYIGVIGSNTVLAIRIEFIITHEALNVNTIVNNLCR